MLEKSFHVIKMRKTYTHRSLSTGSQHINDIGQHFANYNLHTALRPVLRFCPSCFFLLWWLPDNVSVPYRHQLLGVLLRMDKIAEKKQTIVTLLTCFQNFNTNLTLSLPELVCSTSHTPNYRSPALYIFPRVPVSSSSLS